MNSLVANDIESAAYNNRFEFENAEKKEEFLLFSSTRHSNIVKVVDDGKTLSFYSGRNAEALLRKFREYACHDVKCLRFEHPDNTLGDHLHLLGTFFEAAAELPSDPDCANIPSTEALTLVNQRTVQNIYRDRLLAKWDNSCAVTGIRAPELLIASHAKPWADATDGERVDPANGLMLAVQLDALFDKGFITFEDDGRMRFSPQLSPEDAKCLGVTPTMHLRHPLSPDQCKYMAYHRERVFRAHR